jgi:LPXTG-site transpeptidase (sortase) family protein
MKKLKIALILLVIFVSCAFLLLSLWNLNRKEPGSSTSKAATLETIKQPEVHYGVPVRLKIPRLEVDAAIDQMGMTPEGDMQEPSEPQNAGWYKFGPHPGNEGSAVIAGHYGVSKDAPVFNELHTLSRGDIVQVVDEKDTVVTFIVRELRTYDKDAVVPEVFSSSDEKAHLNLITCKGTWQEAQQTYSDRLVVFADKK